MLWKPTMELRYYRGLDMAKHMVQQKWISEFGEDEWRTIPTVSEA